MHAGIRVALAAAAIATASAYAIEAPTQPPPAPAEAPESQHADVVPTDETQFYEHLQRVTHHRTLQGLQVPDAVAEHLARGAADLAVAALSAEAAQGSEAANIALLRIQHWCGRMSSARPSDPQQQIDKLADHLPPERATRAAGIVHAEAAYTRTATEGCRRARFDYGAIEDRLREAADAGRPASATELAQFVRDPKQRDELLESAVEKQYAPAMYALATRRVIDVQRGERTEDVGSIRLLLKQAGRTLPKAKVDFANCVAAGCDGHPANSSTAKAFGLDAARDGEPAAYLSMTRMPWGGMLSRTEMLAWQYFGDRLNEAGCMGDAYLTHAANFARSIQLLTQHLDEQGNEKASQLAATLWQDNAERAKKEQGCQ
jgi:hypothetical protein